MLPMHRNSYDTFLISLYSHGREHLIPDSVSPVIPSYMAAETCVKMTYRDAGKPRNAAYQSA